MNVGVVAGTVDIETNLIVFADDPSSVKSIGAFAAAPCITAGTIVPFEASRSALWKVRVGPIGFSRAAFSIERIWTCLNVLSLNPNSLNEMTKASWFQPSLG